MNNDFVTRLGANRTVYATQGFTNVASLLGEAADEIERLTAEVERLRAMRDAVRGEMARRGLLGIHLGPYEDPDTERFIIPREESDSIAAAWEFLKWLDKETEARRG